MRKLAIFMILVVIMTFPTVSATQTIINVKTAPFYDVIITLLEPVDTYASIKSFPNLYSGAFGTVSANYTGDQQEFHISIIVKKNNVVVIKDKFENHDAGGIIDLELYPEGYGPKDEEETGEDSNSTSNGIDVEVTVENEAEESINKEIESEKGESVTGLAIEGDKKLNIPNYIYYIIVGIILLGIIGFFIARRISGGPPHIQFSKKTSETKGLVPYRVAESTERRLRLAEEKLKEAQAEINKIKNTEKIEAAQEKLREDKEELEKLRRGVA